MVVIDVVLKHNIGKKIKNTVCEKHDDDMCRAKTTVS